MADELRVQGKDPNGNGFLVDLKERKLGLTGPNVALLLLILIIGGVAYIRTGTIDKTMKAGQEQIAGTEDRVHKRVDALFGRMDKFIDDIHAQNTLLTANNSRLVELLHAQQAHEDEGRRGQTALVNSQTEAIRALVEKLTTYIQQSFGEMKTYTEDWFTEMARRDDIHNYNTIHPDKALPLRGSLPPSGPPPERGR